MQLEQTVLPNTRQRAQVLSHQSHDARLAHRSPARTAPATGSRKKCGYP
eukprot:COSAG06_NODE_51984_length_308_cov_1.669856_1_plen_48_part_10